MLTTILLPIYFTNLYTKNLTKNPSIIQKQEKDFSQQTMKNYQLETSLTLEFMFLAIVQVKFTVVQIQWF